MSHNTSISEQQARDVHMAGAIAKAIRELFSIEDSSGQKRYIDITRVPLICQSIVGIDNRLKAIEDNQKWATRVILGAVFLAIIAMLFK